MSAGAGLVVSFVVAASRGLVIGRDGGLPWRLPRDLKHFRKLTWGKPIIMGRKTYESIGRPLPGRLNVVLSRGSFPHPPEVRCVASPERAIEEARASGADEAMVVGGGQVYAAFLPHCSRIHLTRVEGEFQGDAHFPFDPIAAGWRIVHQEHWPADADNRVDADYLVLEPGSAPAS